MNNVLSKISNAIRSTRNASLASERVVEAIYKEGFRIVKLGTNPGYVVLEYYVNPSLYIEDEVTPTSETWKPTE